MGLGMLIAIVLWITSLFLSILIFVLKTRKILKAIALFCIMVSCFGIGEMIFFLVKS